MCLSELIDCRQPISGVHSVMLVFSTQLCDLYSPLLPLSPSLWFNSPPLPPSPIVNKYIYCMVWGSVGDHILQEFYTLYLTRFRTFKIARPPQTKTQEGRGPQTDKHPAKSLYKLFFQMTTFCIAFCESYLSTVYSVIIAEYQQVLMIYTVLRKSLPSLIVIRK